MKRNLAESTITGDALIRQAERIRDPRDYFRGRPADADQWPRNILCFLRRNFTGDQYSRHGRYVLIVCLAGPGEMGTGGQIHRLEVDHCVLVPPFRPHYYFVEDQSLRWLFITFDPPDEASGLEALTVQDMALDALDRAVVTDLVVAWNAGQRVDMALAYLLDRLQRRQPARSTGAVLPEPGNGIDRVTQRIYRDLAHLPTIDVLAADIGMSGGHLRSLFRRRYGTSLGAYIREARLQEAARLLRRTPRRVSEVASEVGFDSAFAFSRAFSRRFGRSPRAWRQASP